MGDAAAEILLDAELWTSMSRAAAADARARFSVDQIVAQYEQLYARAIAGE
jgi:glycosyltransferase involved in cell wall biosynthesis